jgi:hypothetical protein
MPEYHDNRVTLTLHRPRVGGTVAEDATSEHDLLILTGSSSGMLEPDHQEAFCMEIAAHV